MRLTITSDQRFDRLPDGSVWTPDAFAYSYWRPYLEVFDSVRVVGRVRTVERHQGTMIPVEGPNVEVWPLPYYVGPAAFARSSMRLAAAVKGSVAKGDAVILRNVPLAGLFRKLVIRPGQPYACEVVGDPRDVFEPGVIEHPLRPVLRYWLTSELTRQCRSAATAIYVTKNYLQRRYPCAGPMFSASDVQLGKDAFVASARERFRPGGTVQLVTVGTLDQLYKGQDLLITAVSQLAGKGRDVRLTFVGGGRHRDLLAGLAAKLGVQDRVTFTGALPGSAAVRERLDAADLFVFPSRTEGLPRALIEAMARALPCVASDAGGIPELLDAADLVPRGDADRLAEKIDEVIGSETRMRAMSERNLARAHEYEQEKLLATRIEFYRTLRERTAHV